MPPHTPAQSSTSVPPQTPLQSATQSLVGVLSQVPQLSNTESPVRLPLQTPAQSGRLHVPLSSVAVAS